MLVALQQQTAKKDWYELNNWILYIWCDVSQFALHTVICAKQSFNQDIMCVCFSVRSKSPSPKKYTSNNNLGADMVVVVVGVEDVDVEVEVSFSLYFVVLKS